MCSYKQVIQIAVHQQGYWPQKTILYITTYTNEQWNSVPLPQNNGCHSANGTHINQYASTLPMQHRPT